MTQTNPLRRAAGSYGSRHGTNWSRGGADYRKRRETQLPETAAGVAEQLLPASPEALRRAIEAQVCPWCGAGPYKMLAAHTHKTHGVTGPELRKFAGYSQRASICSPDQSASRRERLLARPDREEITERGNRRSVEIGAWRAAADGHAKWLQERNGPKHAEILALYQANPAMQLRHIAERVGLHARTVHQILADAGIDLTGHRSRMRKGRRFAGYDQIRQTRLQAVRLLQEERLRRFVELGSDWAAVVRCAREWGTSNKAARAYLQKVGAPVPDGRSDGPPRTPTRALVLAHLAAHPTSSQTDIAHVIGMRQNSVSKVMRRLIADGRIVVVNPPRGPRPGTYRVVS